ncbi:uncharacterized protein LOC132720487 [Ruditapes philippinarum]|uniref:uncharacterized protein LOC132720487 n=1 Tax=Ruditapes philippinarum TaxID=129788 RepID=UPI00295C2F15|nr:uncharacterized protein LOC132720487 [Ruditapes philippinarum]
MTTNKKRDRSMERMQEFDKRSLRENWGQIPPGAAVKSSGAKSKGVYHHMKTVNDPDSRSVCKQRKTVRSYSGECKTQQAIHSKSLNRSEVNQKRKRKKKELSNHCFTCSKHEKIKSETTGKEIQSQKCDKKCSEADGKNIFSGKKAQAKTTYLYIVIGDNITKTSNLKQFLVHRMGNPTALDFELKDVANIHSSQNLLKKSIIKVKFESYKKASAARYLLNISNRNVSSKVRCFFKRTEAEGEEVDNALKRKTKLENTCKEIDESTERELDKHDKKIRDVYENFSRVNELLKKGIHMSEFGKIFNEQNAFKDKLQELERQRVEFLNCIACMKSCLENLITHDKFEQEVNKIRKEFGVECRRLSVALPIYARREDILTAIRNNQVCIILGETGSGKSTQMVQYLYQAGFAANGVIACTQPRKIAALSLAAHVASELACNVGHVVGYKVGMKTTSTGLTKVLFMTDNVLLNECLQDRILSKYSCIIIDEAHERSIHTDLLLGMLKESISERPDLKVIITSATIDPFIFKDFFGGHKQCPVLKISGKTFPVDTFWDETNCFDNPFPEDYEEKALRKAIEVHTSTKIEEGDILVFVTAALEADRCVEKMKSRVNEKEIQCLQLHGKQRTAEQQIVFERTPKCKRKIVFATNCAETSITIPGIKFVIDTGVVKEMRYDANKNINSLNVSPVSQSSANQRKGRAGRTASGKCYRLYTEEDFRRMEKNALPEILRVQVSKALLNLMEYGVNPLNFHYVQSPSTESMQNAMLELTELGAIHDLSLTDIGKLIAKLPVEPKLGVLIKKGIEMDIGIEAIVIASSCNQTGMFFRVGTQDERKLSDVKKTKFCHQNGDLLTHLNVYREWNAQPEKEKGKWCERNYINGKVMKEIRETINEVVYTLNKDAGVKIKHHFRSTKEADILVQDLLFECMSSELGYYLGHESAGYLILKSKQRVQVHPSSAIMSLGYQPTWIVFNRTLKTTADFITGVTPVNEEAVCEALTTGKISFDLNFLETQKITLACHILVGKHVYWQFVGNMHKNRQVVEDRIRKECEETLVIIETNKKQGKISLFCLPEFIDKAIVMLQRILEPIPSILLRESKEMYIGNENSGIRIVLREGGEGVDVLLPNEFRSIKIFQKESTQNYHITEESARELFEFYGQVESISRPSKKKRQQKLLWGNVTYFHQTDASVALEEINNDADIEIVGEQIALHNNIPLNSQSFKMKLTWFRRLSRGYCFVNVTEVGDIPILLDSAPIINGIRLEVSPAREQSDLYITGLTQEITEEDVKKALLEVLEKSFNDNMDRFKIIIPRTNAIFKSNELEGKNKQISKMVSFFGNTDDFDVQVKRYGEKTVICTAHVWFTDPQTCHETAERMINGNAQIDRSKVHVSLECNSTVYISNNLFQIVKEDIDTLITRYKDRESSTTIEIVYMKSGNVALIIKTLTFQKLAKAKAKVDEIVGGEELKCEDDCKFRVMFRKDGKEYIKEVEKETNTIILTDERVMTVYIQGLQHNRNRAVDLIKVYSTEQQSSLEKDIRLKGDENPPGLMKALLVKYGTDFEVLKEETGITGVYLEPRLHEITITGTKEATEKATECINRIKENICISSVVNAFENELPDCPICLFPVEESDMYILEYCGHAYCRVCLASQIQNAVKYKQLPIICASENCNKPLVIRDINFQLKVGNIKKKALLDASLACLVGDKSKPYRYCITPDCSIVYRTSRNGNVFVCPMCQVRICTSCHTQYHDGLSCFMYKNAGKEKYEVDVWLRRDPVNRKRCPKCRCGIEKKGGCNKIYCTLCKAHVCWKCMKYYPEADDCYRHLQKKHGSFY